MKNVRICPFFGRKTGTERPDDAVREGLFLMKNIYLPAPSDNDGNQLCKRILILVTLLYLLLNILPGG